MASTQPDTPPPPYQERYSTVQPSQLSYDTSISTISYPKSTHPTSNEVVDDCCTDCNCNECLQCCHVSCNVFLCCIVLFECCTAFK